MLSKGKPSREKGFFGGEHIKKMELGIWGGGFSINMTLILMNENGAILIRTGANNYSLQCE
jgi:hypothetical protein